MAPTAADCTAFSGLHHRCANVTSFRLNAEATATAFCGFRLQTEAKIILSSIRVNERAIVLVSS